MARTVYLAIGVLVPIWVFFISTNKTRLFQDATEWTTGLLSPGTELLEAEATTGPRHGDAADAALKELCSNTIWKEGLWLNCHSSCGPNRTSICGGLNNARNRLQTCLRLAIDIGAGVMFPYVTQRSDENLAELQESVICPDVWWDMDALTTSMGELCPSLRISPCEENPNIENILDLTGRHYADRPHYGTTFRQFVDNDLAGRGFSLASASRETPLVLRYADSHIAWDYRASGELNTLRKALFRILPFNEGLLSIGNAILSSPGLQSGDYIGIHLRAEGDWPGGWGTPAHQMNMHAAEIRRMNANTSEPITDIYVSAGDKVVIQAFRDMMAAENYKVHDKWTLLADRPELLYAIEHLAFDQKGVVEYTMLVRGRYFQGNLRSTMSSLVAYARTMDQPDFFQTYIYPMSQRWGMGRVYAEPLTMHGDNFTKVLVVNDDDIMDAFP